MSSWFPLFIDIEDRKITVIGAGRIATRRIRSLLESGAAVTVIAPAASDEVSALAAEGRVDWKKEGFIRGKGLLDGSVFVLSATDDRNVDTAVYEECKSLSIPVNIASDKDKCDFYFPGLAKGGGVTAGITAGGCDHHLAFEATRRIQKLLDDF